jgi:hypothetical protein
MRENTNLYTLKKIQRERQSISRRLMPAAMANSDIAQRQMVS